MCVRRLVSKFVLASTFLVTAVSAETETNGEDVDRKEYTIELFSNDPPNDWARIARELVQNDLVEVETKPYDSLGPCATVLEELGFRSTDIKLGCSSDVERLISDLTDGTISGVEVPEGQVAYPVLPIRSIGAVNVYDTKNAVEVLRCQNIKSPWGVLANTVCRPEREPTGFVELRGFEVRASIPDTNEGREVIESFRRFNSLIGRNDIDVIDSDETQPYGSINSVDGSKWLESCLANRPSYSEFLGISKMPTCKCTDDCPEIILFDRTPALHPAIAHKVDASVDLSQAPLQCDSVDKFNPQEHHASHLAGILVSQDVPEHFSGISPMSTLTWRNSSMGTAFLDIRKISNINKVIKDFSTHGVMKVILFTTSWNYDEKDRARLQQGGNFRLANPKYVETIINGPHLWVVAAGNGDEEKKLGFNISTQFEQSPVNIGDQRNVLVVAACEDCNSRAATLTDYSNFSSSGLVHVAAHGGLIAAPATASEYALSSGTSQAAAIVAGLASSINCAWPEYNWTPRGMKVRLQSAVFPPFDESLRSGLSAGVVDASKALLDPERHYVAVRGKLARPANLLEWCVDKVRPESPFVADQDADGGPVKPSLLRHLVASDTPRGERQYFIFHEPDIAARQSAGQVLRTGPGVIDEGKLLRVTFSDGNEPRTQVLSAEDIEFVLTPPGLERSAKIEVNPSACN